MDHKQNSLIFSNVRFAQEGKVMGLGQKLEGQVEPWTLSWFTFNCLCDFTHKMEAFWKW